MSNDTIQKLVTLRDVLWIATLLIGAGMAIASFATKTEVQTGFDTARKDRTAEIDKAFQGHKADQERDMERLWKKLDQMDSKLDRIKR